jgi:hypothetical protein
VGPRPPGGHYRPPLVLRGVVLVWLATVALVAVPAASANGDPPSDVLLVTDVYRPYLPPLRPAVRDALSSTVARARQRGHPVKVALIASVIDLGNVPNLWAQPRNYAHFLAQELRLPAAHGSRGATNALRGHTVLVVVMPQGVAVEGGISRSGARRAAAGIRVDAGPGAEVGAASRAYDSNALAQAAIDAVVEVARAQGVRLSALRIPPPAASNESRSWIVPLVAAVVVLGAAAVGIAFVLRRVRLR